MRGGMEAIYDDLNEPVGLARLAPVAPARGRLFSARRRVGGADPLSAPVVAEHLLYKDELNDDAAGS